MKKLVLNREFAVRHLGVALLMLGLSGWFAYDGYVNYPKQDESYFTERHLKKANAIQRQKEFMFLALIAALVIAGHVALVAHVLLEYDETGFVFGGKRRAYADVKSVDWSKWKKKGIVVVDGIALDAWHHTGVKEIVQRLEEAGKGPAT